jgi:hypothetical protein
MVVMLLGVAGCADGIPRDIDPRIFVDNLFGAHLEGRERPPNLQQPYPRLSVVPARPVPPTPEERAALSAALAADRERSLVPQPPGGAPVLADVAPPGRPRLAPAPRVPFDAAPAPAQPFPEAAPPGDPGAVPALPGADLLAPRPN